MSTVFQELRDEHLTQALEELLVPNLARVVAARALGHCMRVADLDRDLMVAVGKSLRAAVPGAQVHILGGEDGDAGQSLFITSTKLVELRNPLPDGTLRPPLLVLLPPNLHTNAEDSFNVASFEELSVTDVYEALTDKLFHDVPSALQGYISEIFAYLRREGWNWTDAVARCRFLLTALRNGIDGETLGASLYELGLVPDYQLFADTSLVFGRVRKNLESVRRLNDSDRSIRGRVLELELTDREFQQRLTEFLIGTGVDDPRNWARRIVSERKKLSFDKWKFRQDITTERLTVQVLSLDLPTVGEKEDDERLRSLVGQQVLVPKDRRQLKAIFEADPHPSQVPGLGHFTVQIVAKDSGPIGVAKKVKAWRSRGNTKSVTLDKLNNVKFEEGWHFIRILAWTEDGDPMRLLDAVGEITRPEAKPYESELFYVMPEGELEEEEPPQRAVPQEPSLAHAKLRLQLAAVSARRDPQDVAVKSVAWVDQSAKTKKSVQETLEVKFGRDGTFRVPVSGALKDIEQSVLAEPDRLISWHMQISVGQLRSSSQEYVELQSSASAESFMSARAAFFEALGQGDVGLVSQAVNFLAVEAACLAYADAYRDLLNDLLSKVDRGAGADQQRAIISLRSALTIDTVRIIVSDFRGKLREAAMLGPTHPLRALWLAVWSRVAENWITAASIGPEEYVGPVREALLRGLSPLNFPPTLPISDGRVFLSVDNVHPFWALYAPASEVDSRGLVGEVCAALALSEPSIGGAVVTGEVIATRIERYLIQHPYIRTLTVNAFNPGRATVLAEALLTLQKRAAFAQLRYEIRLFVPDPDAPGVGEAIELLLSPTGIVSEEADAFSTAGGSHLHPKLNLAIHSTADFRVEPGRYRAHLSLLFDLFPAEEIGAAPAFRRQDVAPLHGLIQDFVTSYRDDEAGTFWRRQPRHGNAAMLDEAEDLIDVLAELPGVISAATATVAIGEPGLDLRPVVTMGLDADRREFMHQIHEASDWVFTIDRNLGIEFFDHGGQRERPPYLVDYTPGAAASFGHRLVITSRSLSEITSTLRQVLSRYGLPDDEARAELVLDNLRSLSGRVALKLISSPTQQAEALGLALARRFLEYQGALADQIIVPLDAHLELFRAVKQQADELGEAVSLQRTDLALFELDTEARKVRCNLVEVKCYTHVGGLSAYQQLRESVSQQITQSEEVLRRHFDPKLKKPDRPDRLLKVRELSVLLEFYLNRSIRYGLMEEQAAEKAHAFLANLEMGYELEFTRSALIFDFETVGTEAPDYEFGIEYHRIGFDIVEALIVPSPASETKMGTTVPIDTVPKLTTAAFLPAEHIRKTSDTLLQRNSDAVIEEVEDVHTIGILEDDSDLPPGPRTSEELQRDGSEWDNSSAGSASDPEIDMPLQGIIRVESPEEESRSELIPETPVQSPGTSGPSYDVMLGVQGASPQYGLIGEVSGRKVALDLNQTHTISLFGVQGGGKSYTLGSIVEMACLQLPKINLLPSPLATVIFHYSPTQDYKPEFTSMVRPNSEAEQVEALLKRYGAEPAALTDVVILAPSNKVDERRAEYPDVEIHPIAFSAAELKASHWKFLMGAVGSQSMYLRQVNLIMRKLRESLTLDSILQGVENSGLSDHLKDLAKTRLQFAAEYIDDQLRISEVIRPGRLIIVDLRDEFIEKDEALGLFVVLLQIFSEAIYKGRQFNKLVVFDEAHKYIESPDLVAGLIEVVREMRHKGTSIMVASQDPPSVPAALIELSSQIILHKFNSPAWLKHIQKANAALNELTPDRMSRLGPGEAYVWSSKATDDVFAKGAVKVRCRPRVTQHGGGTKTAVS